MDYNQNQQQYGQAQGYYNQPSPQQPGNIHYGQQQQQQYNPPPPQGYYQPQAPMNVQQQPTQNRSGMGGCMACLSGLLCCCLAEQCCDLIC